LTVAAIRNMPAAVLNGVEDLSIAEVERPVIRRDTEVLLDVTAAGVCGTDLHAIHEPASMGVPPGTILGHEFVGVAREVGAAVRSVTTGDRVVVAPNVSCGWCQHCRLGLPNHCLNNTTYGLSEHGGFAPHAVVEEVACLRVPDRLSDRLAVLAEPLSTVVAGVRLAEPFPGELAVVIGLGPIGMMYSAVLSAAGMRVVAIEPAPARAAVGEDFGADVVLEYPQAAPEAIEEATGGMGADAVIDTSGRQIELATRLARKAGRIVLFGAAPGFRAEISPGTIQEGELRVVGCLIGRATFLPALRLLDAGIVDLDAIVSEEVGLSDLPDAIARQRRQETLKPVVRFS